LSALAVSAAVDLDHQLEVVTCEVGEVWPNRRLAAEVTFLHRKLAQMPPQLSLGIGHVAAQPTRGRDTAI